METIKVGAVFSGYDIASRGGFFFSSRLEFLIRLQAGELYMEA